MGRLVVISTPIGNLGDLSPRAVAELAGADVIVCEDTRRTRTLLTHAGVKGPRRIVANEHTEAAAAAHVADLLAEGATVALVTDAGTPGVSDPGERLVRAAIAGGHDVTAVPGPSAALAALVSSGLPVDRFVVEGFLPRRGPERRSRIDEVAREPRTVVLFEAPHRLARTLADLTASCGPQRPVVLARELTKLHEEVWRGTLGEAVARVAAQEPRGEYVVVLGGAPPPEPATLADVDAALVARRAAGIDRKTAVSEVAYELRVPKRAVYDAALRLYPAR
jgi:16S rRNA (cytidine1402-2'-O)-methyltransferase